MTDHPHLFAWKRLSAASLSLLVFFTLAVLFVSCADDSSQKTDGDQEENETQPDGDELDGDSPDLDGDSPDGDEDLDAPSEREKEEEAEERPTQGAWHLPCYSDGTCNVGLHCENNLCEADQEVTWVRIPGGTFWMGCGGEGTCTPENRAQFAKPRHQVTVPAFELTQTEVTGSQIYAAMGVYPPNYRPANDPAFISNWQYAKSICEALGGRLPTEAEWEYAARAGTETDYYCGNDLDCLKRITRYCSGEPDFCPTGPVGETEPNAFGLYDMIGNYAEVCEDTYQYNYDGAPTDGSAWVVEPAEGFNAIHVIRGDYVSEYYNGGAIGVFKVWLRWRGYGSTNIGFRCARDIQEEDGDTEEFEEDTEQ